MKRQRGPAEALRNAIAALPHRSKTAMLEGIEDNPIIVGAYVDGDGGVCPMLAAHRNGGRTSLASFARAWDRYTDASRVRRATLREVENLKAMLSASLADDVDIDERDVAEAIADHKRLVARREATTVHRPRPGDRDRSKELRRREGWAWTRPFRRYDQYEAAMAAIEETAPAEERELVTS
ncbi:MAG: hypothetical protein H0U42_07890 [Thermoleophilaceae bacterium]|nr:hypothetical protein [Thermoleophilaceae bacterium]